MKACPSGARGFGTPSDALEGGQSRQLASQTKLWTLLEDLRMQVEAQKLVIKDLGMENACLRENLREVVSRVDGLEFQRGVQHVLSPGRLPEKKEQPRTQPSSGAQLAASEGS